MSLGEVMLQGERNGNDVAGGDVIRQGGLHHKRKEGDR